MKIAIALLLSMLLFACKNQKKPVLSKGDAEQAVITQGDDDKIATLQKLTPLTAEQLKDELPAAPGDFNRGNADADNSMGASMAKAEYTNADSMTATLTVFDCAGDEGVGIFNTRYLMQLKMHKQSGSFDGNKTIEQENAATHSASFTWLAGKRYLCTLETQQVSLATLKDLAKEIKFR